MEEKRSTTKYRSVQEARKRDYEDGQNPKVYSIIKDYSSNEEPPKGEPQCKCAKCGTVFDQDYYADRNTYSAFKTCHRCRVMQSKKKESKVKGENDEISVAKLPFEMYPWQEEEFEAFKTHRFLVWALGNRAGKDFTANMFGIWYFVQCLNENRHIEQPTMAPSVLWWIVAPNERLAKQNWRDLKKQFPKDWIVACDNTNMVMETICGGVIEVRSAYDPEQLVGSGVDLCTVTEAARIKDLLVAVANIEARLNSPQRGLASDRKGAMYGCGKMIINSTPLGKNGFYTVFCWGSKEHPNYSSGWHSVQLPWTCNLANEQLAKTIVHTKYGEMTYEEDIRRRIGDRTFRQNYKADFLAGDGSVFKDFEEKCCVNVFAPEMKLDTDEKRKEFTLEWQKPNPLHHYRIGYDPATGSSEDNPTIVIRDMATNRIVRQFNMYGKNYDSQYSFIASWSAIYNHAPCAWLRTGHTAIEGQLVLKGVREIPLDEQGQNKAKYVQSLELAVQNSAVQVLLDGSEDAQTLMYQMNDYTEKNGQYSNQEMDHDDYVSAMYAAYFDYSIIEQKMPFSNRISGVRK
jgi:hypothetical protein